MENQVKSQCRCGNTSCGCAGVAAEPCTCGERCECKSACRCGGGCNCKAAK